MASSYSTSIDIDDIRVWALSMMVARVVLDMDHEQGENAGRAFQTTLRNFALASFQSEGVSLTEVEKQDVATMVARLNKLIEDMREGILQQHLQER